MKKFKVAVISMLIFAMLSFTACGNNNNKPQESDKYRITVACQSEESEGDILRILAEAFEAKNPDYDIEIKTFTGQDFESYMLGNFAQNIEKSPHIVWTSDSIHARWHRYFTDLRPFYERDLTSTDYSLYYESMLDTASLNGEFRPTKNYTGSFRADKKDTKDGTEIGDNHSEYGIYYAPRDYNKPAIVCNTKLFADLDAAYEQYVGALPEGEMTTTQRLNDIVAGNDWNELDDLFAFAQLIAERRNAVIDAALNEEDIKLQQKWEALTAIDLKLNWEPTYVTFLNAMGIKTMFNADGTISLDQESEKLVGLHDKMYAVPGIVNSDGADTDFATGKVFLKIVSRPVVLGFINAFEGTYGEACLQSIQIPVQDIAAGNSGYAMNYYYYNQSVTVKGVTKSYADICWDFIKFVITTEGQEVAGASGSNVPVLKSLYADGAWRKVAKLSGMNHEAFVAGGELKQNWYDIYNPISRAGFRGQFATFFTNFTKENYGNGSLEALFATTKTSYNALDPTGNVR
ncbi:MAG: carbohydrate ABC transporter substrate-binding protein [Clostridia bacterium]|nr:carbohydrate ABC transporter substrate-binding protein [Clostridia bacterium]